MLPNVTIASRNGTIKVSVWNLQEALWNKFHRVFVMPEMGATVNFYCLMLLVDCVLEITLQMNV